MIKNPFRIDPKTESKNGWKKKPENDPEIEPKGEQKWTTNLKKVAKMLKDGMDLLDVGGQSTRPGSDLISAEIEAKRVISAIEKIHKEFPKLIISIDTFWSEVAQQAVENGAAIINDVSGGNLDPKMFETVAKLNVPYVLMHMQGTPKNMQQKPDYKNVVLEVNQYLAEKITMLKALHINDIILDVGYGFGKTVEQNFELLRNQSLIGFGDYPILAGLSRKSMICKTLKIKPEYALNGTTALNMLALQNGANILRVHDVKEAKECVILHNSFAS